MNIHRILTASFFFALASLTPLGAVAMPSSYATADEAAVAFVDLVRSYSEQRTEYCAWLINTSEGRVRFGTISDGGTDKCPLQWPKPDGTLASVHTHPIWGPGAQDPSSASQVFSEGDYANAESPEAGVPIYLGAPAGHVLRYDPGNSTCWGNTLIRRRFIVVRDLNPSVLGRLPVDPDRRVPLFDLAGKPIPRPDYCRDPGFSSARPSE
jgi:hypothetical protein